MAKTAVITGANVGIGRATAEALAKDGWHLVLACRSEEKTLPVIEALKQNSGNPNIHFEALDLSSMRAAQDAGRRVAARYPSIDALINNAGVANFRGVTVDGYEWTFGVNHLGHAAWTTPLLDAVKAARGRIVVVASKAHYRTKGIPFERLKMKTSFIGYPEYMVSKLANVLYAKSLAKRLSGSGVEVYSLHPGVIASDIWRSLPWPIRPLILRKMKTVEEGAQTTLYCVRSGDVVGQSGSYFSSCAERTPSEAARDEALAERLWTYTEEAIAHATATA